MFNIAFIPTVLVSVHYIYTISMNYTIMHAYEHHLEHHLAILGRGIYSVHLSTIYIGFQNTHYYRVHVPRLVFFLDIEHIFVNVRTFKNLP